MASVPFVIERHLHYHGIWNAGYNIGELFLKSISKEFATKHPYPAVLKLSVSSLTLTVYHKSISHTREIRTDTIPFVALRDIAVNAFNNRCLMVIYVNNKNKFSVLVTSGRNAKETADVAMAFKNLSAIVQARKLEAERSNWIVRKSISSSSPTTTMSTTNNSGNNISTEAETTPGANNADEHDGTRLKNDETDSDSNEAIVRDASLGPFDDSKTNGHPPLKAKASDSSSVNSRTMSSVLTENFDFLRDHEVSFDEDSVFGEAAAFDKEEGPGKNSFSVGLQVDIQDRSDRISISSDTSFLSFQSIKDEVDSVNPNSAIAEEEYSKRTVVVAVDGSVQNGDERDGGLPESSVVNGYKGGEHSHVTKVDKTEAYDFRSVGTQTEGLGRTRYTKKSGTVGSPNMYKAMAAQRKLKQNSEDSTPPPVTTSIPMTTAARPGSYYVSHDFRGGTSSNQSVLSARPVRLPAGSRSTVSRPIEEVYQRSHTWSRRGTGDARRRKVVIVHSGKNTLRI